MLILDITHSGKLHHYDYSIMIIAFSGHRNCLISDEKLLELKDKFGCYKWINGGAKYGFDRQIKEFAFENNIEFEDKKYLPNFEKYGRSATFIRNKLIVDDSYYLICCYDGREFGGTKHTLKYAKSIRTKNIIVLSPDMYIAKTRKMIQYKNEQLVFKL